MDEKLSHLKVIVFNLGDEEYAVPVDSVGSIERLQHITYVPNTPAFVKGVINLRGVVTPIIDLRQRFDLEPAEYTERSRIIVVSVEDKEVGMIVDGANDVVDLDVNEIERAPEVVGSVEEDFIQGVAKVENRLLVLLNLERVLATEQFEKRETFEA